MSIKDSAQNAHRNLLNETDPELAEIVNNFAFDEVQEDVDLPSRTKMLSTLAYLLGCQGLDEFKLMLPVALDNEVTPVEAKEVVYQAIDYLGLGRVLSKQLMKFCSQEGLNCHLKVNQLLILTIVLQKVKKLKSACLALK